MLRACQGVSSTHERSANTIAVSVAPKKMRTCDELRRKTKRVSTSCSIATRINHSPRANATTHPKVPPATKRRETPPSDSNATPMAIPTKVGARYESNPCSPKRS
eukprot:5822752-Prymnesium_polylepis.1